MHSDLSTTTKASVFFLRSNLFAYTLEIDALLLIDSIVYNLYTRPITNNLNYIGTQISLRIYTS